MKRKIIAIWGFGVILALAVPLRSLISWRTKPVLDLRRPHFSSNGLKQIALGNVRFTNLQIAPDESHLAVIRNDQLQVWRLDPPRLRRQWDAHKISNFAWSLDSRKLVIIPSPNFPAQGGIWDTSGFELVLLSSNPSNLPASDTHFSPDGRTVRLASLDEMRVYQMHSGQLLSQKSVSALTQSARDGNDNPRIVLSKDGHIAFFQRGYSALESLDMRARKTLWRRNASLGEQFQLSLRGDFLVYAKSASQFAVADARSGRTLWSVDYPTRPLSLKFTFSSDGRELIASDGAQIFVYDSQTGALQRTLNRAPYGIVEMRAAPQSDAIYFLDSWGNVFHQRAR